MSDTSTKSRLRKLSGVAALLLLLLMAILTVPFLLPTLLARLALRYVFPAHTPSIGSVTLTWGTLTLRDLVLHDTGALAQQPLITAREVESAFSWTELLSLQIRRIRAKDVIIYVQSNGPSQFSLLDLFFQPSSYGPPTKEFGHSALPLWINTLNVQGRIHLEPVRGFGSASADWPLMLQMTMSGDRMAPAWQLRVAVGETRQLPENIFEKPSIAAPDLAPRVAAVFGLRAEVESRSAAGGTNRVEYSLAVRQGALTFEADTLRRYTAAKLPAELQGRIEMSLGNLLGSGTLDLHRSEEGKQLSASLTFTDLRVRVLGNSAVTLTLGGIAGAAKIDTPLPPGPGTAIAIERLQARNTEASIETEVMRRYTPKLPADLHGPINTNFEVLDVSGLIGSGADTTTGFSGNIRLRDLNIRLPAGGKYAFALERLTVAGHVESPLDRWALAALKVRDGVMQWAAFTSSNHAVNNFQVSWQIDNQTLLADRGTAQIFGGQLNGSLARDLLTQDMPRCDLQIKSINLHEALANISPEHIDAEGSASGSLHLTQNAEGEMSGYIELTFDGPGVLKIGEIEEIKQMLVGNFGLDLANLAMQDLKHYPVKEGWLYLESAGKNSQLKLKFVRQPRTGTEVAQPRKEIINGTEVWVGSLVVPTIDMTIPITGKSLGEILSIVSGIHPLIEAVGEQPGK